MVTSRVFLHRSVCLVCSCWLLIIYLVSWSLEERKASRVRRDYRGVVGIRHIVEKMGKIWRQRGKLKERLMILCREQENKLRTEKKEKSSERLGVMSMSWPSRTCSDTKSITRRSVREICRCSGQGVRRKEMICCWEGKIYSKKRKRGE